MSESPWIHVDNQSFLIDVASDRRTPGLYHADIVADSNDLVRSTISVKRSNRLARTRNRRAKATIGKF